VLQVPRFFEATDDVSNTGGSVCYVSSREETDEK